MTTGRQRPLETIRGSHPLRGREATRALLHRPLLQAADLVMPLLMVDHPARGTAEGLVPTYTLDTVAEEAAELAALGIRGVKIFAASANKDRAGSEAPQRRRALGSIH